jgi:hypothetical protein
MKKGGAPPRSIRCLIAFASAWVSLPATTAAWIWSSAAALNAWAS